MREDAVASEGAEPADGEEVTLPASRLCLSAALTLPRCGRWTPRRRGSARSPRPSGPSASPKSASCLAATSPSLRTPPPSRCVPSAVCAASAVAVSPVRSLRAANGGAEPGERRGDGGADGQRHRRQGHAGGARAQRLLALRLALSRPRGLCCHAVAMQSVACIFTAAQRIPFGRRCPPPPRRHAAQQKCRVSKVSHIPIP